MTVYRRASPLPGRSARVLLAAGAVTAALTAPAWLPDTVVALRGRVFTRVNGPEGVSVPGAGIDAEQFAQLYAHPAVNGRSRGAALSDLFWYWLSPGPHVHQEHQEPGPRYDETARCTLAVLSGTSEALAAAAGRATAAVLDELPPGAWSLVRLRDLMMPVWAAFFHELVFHEPCPPDARRLIVDNAEAVINSLKCTRPRRMARRHRLTRYLLARLDAGEVPHELPASLSRQERAYYLQGTFFNTAVVQLSEGMAHLLLALAQNPEHQEELAAHPEDARAFGRLLDETLRLYPLFGIAHRITTGEVRLADGLAFPEGTVLCFDYPAYHSTGYQDGDRFDPSRWERLSARDAPHIPFGVAANRPCPAWRLSPLVMRAATAEVLRRYRLDSTVSHTRSIPHRAPCLLIPRQETPHRGRLAAARRLLRFRDRWEDVGRSLLQLVLGTWMVLDARRLRPAASWFAEHDTEGRPLNASRDGVPGPAASGDAAPGAARCPFPHGGPPGPASG